MVPTLPADALVRAQTGEPAALSPIYRSLSPAVLGYFAGRGSEDPEALTQDVFLAVFSRLGSVTGELPGLRTFIFSVAHARYVDEVRRRTRAPVLVGYEVDGDTRTTDSAEELALGNLDVAGGRCSNSSAPSSARSSSCASWRRCRSTRSPRSSGSRQDR